MQAIQSMRTTSGPSPRIRTVAAAGAAWLSRSARRAWSGLEAIGQWRARRELHAVAERYSRSDPSVAAMLRAAADDLGGR